jgi:hypothetical protein
MFPICFFYNKACNWSIEFLQIVNISKLYHILGSNHSTFYVWSFQVLFPYKFLVLKMRILLFTKYMWKTITFHCLPSSRWMSIIEHLNTRFYWRIRQCLSWPSIMISLVKPKVSIMKDTYVWCWISTLRY